MKRELRIFERLALCAALVITAMLGYPRTSHAEPTEKEPAPVRPIGEEHALGEAKIYAALEQPVSIEIIEVALGDFVQSNSIRFDIPIVLSKRALAGIGVGPDTPITRSLTDIPLRSALRIVLGELGLTFVVTDEVLLITTKEEAKAHLITHVYEVRDLMEFSHDPFLDSDSLIELLLNNLAPSTWDVVGGPGSVVTFDNSLAVRQSREVHEQVQALLTQLRRAKYALEQSPVQALQQSFPVPFSTASATEKKIQAALAAPTPPMEFMETPLLDIVIYLKNTADIPILLDRHSLDRQGITADTPVTQNLRGISLRSALKLMLKELQLVTIVRDNVMFITTEVEAESQLNTRIFLVRDLLDTEIAWASNSDELLELITFSVAPRTWDEVGGAGSIQHFRLLDAIVISQTESVLDEVEALLTKLRKARNAREPWSPEDWKEREATRLTTVQFVELNVRTGYINKPVAEPAAVLVRLQKLLDKELVARANMKVTEQGITMFLAPADFPALNRAIERGNLPLHRLDKDTYGLRFWFNHKGINGGFGGTGSGGAEGNEGAD